MGFDNAHAIKSKTEGKYKGRRVVQDRKHISPVDKGTPYSFADDEQLLHDFFRQVNKILDEV